MTADHDPFRHHPELRQKIVDPLDSSFRSMDIALLDEKMSAAGAPKTWRHSDAYREATRRATMKDRWHHDLWVFAYGSLMWDPGFHFREVRHGTLAGYHRRFCLRSELGRGTKEQPGLMAGLDRGGACHGLVFRIAQDQLDEETALIWKREMLLHAYEAMFLAIETRLGEVEALAFVIDPSARNYLPVVSDDRAAHYVATGEGVLGTSLDYVENLAAHFEGYGRPGCGSAEAPRSGARKGAAGAKGRHERRHATGSPLGPRWLDFRHRPRCRAGCAGRARRQPGFARRRRRDPCPRGSAPPHFGAAALAFGDCALDVSRRRRPPPAVRNSGPPGRCTCSRVGRNLACLPPAQHRSGSTRAGMIPQGRRRTRPQSKLS